MDSTIVPFDPQASKGTLGLLGDNTIFFLITQAYVAYFHGCISGIMWIVKKNVKLTIHSGWGGRFDKF